MPILYWNSGSVLDLLLPFLKYLVRLEVDPMACVRVCQMLSNFYRSINLFRYDTSRKIVYVIAGPLDEFKIIVPPDGDWEFDETWF